MKKKLLILLFAAFAFIPTTSKAQLVDGSIAPDWTFTDINGNSQHLYHYLDSGYTVVFNVCVTWCGPCWAYHTGGALKDLYINHGPIGYPGVSASSTNR